MDEEQIKQIILAPRSRRSDNLKADDFLSTGSTLLNLAISGMPDGGFPIGRYVFYVGDSSSGKTFFALTCLAEAQLNDRFKNHRIIFDDAEDGALMDFRKFFGDKVAERIEPPDRDADGNPLNSSTVEEFYFNIDNALQEAKEKKGRPFIYVLDSMDSLSSVYEGKKFQEKKTKGDKAKGDYGDGKAKVNSRYIRRVRAGLQETGSLLIIICQTRDNIDAGLFENPKTRSGGHALQFYSHVEVWTSKAGSQKKSVRGKERQVGITARLSVKKNRVSGKEWSVKVPIYWSSGIDEIGSLVDYLVEEKHWPKNKAGVINGTGDFKGCEGRREDVVKFVEANDLEADLKEIVAEVWKDVEAACRVERKKKYL